MSTARTRRLVSSSVLMPSLMKMEVVYLLIAPSLRNRRSEIAVLERPSAIRASTDLSRSVSVAMGSARAGRPSSFATTVGSSAVPPRPRG